MRPQILSVLAALICVGTTAPALAVDPSEIVMLEVVGGVSGGCSNGYAFSRNSATGAPLGIFTVPTGRVLTITDIDWQYVAATGAGAADTIQTLRLFAVAGKSKDASSVRIFESTVTLSRKGEGGTTTITQTPAAILPGALLCVDVSPGPIAGGGGLQHVILRGGLVPGFAK